MSVIPRIHQRHRLGVAPTYEDVRDTRRWVAVHAWLLRSIQPTGAANSETCVKRGCRAPRCGLPLDNR